MPASPAIDTTAARSMPGVVAVFTGADLAAEQGSLPCAWPITEDMKAPPHPPLAVDTVNVRRRGRGRRGGPRRATRRTTRSRRSTSTTSAAGRCSTGGRGRRRRGRWCTRTWAPTSAPSGRSTPRRPAPAATSKTAIREAAEVHRAAHVPPAAADPGVHGTALGGRRPDRRADHHVVRHPDPAHPAADAGADAGIPEHKLRVIAPDVGGGFGGKLQVTPEEVIALLVARRLGKPVKYTESRSASRCMSAHHGRDQIQQLTLAARRDGTVTGLKVELLADMGAYLRLVTPGHPDPRRVHVQRHLQVPVVPLHVHQRLHQQDAHRRLPRRRAAGGDVRHRTDDGRTRRRAGMDPLELRAAELDHPRGVPVRHRRRPDLRLRQLRGRHRAGAGVVRLRRAAARAGRAPRARATRYSSASASPRSPRCAVWRRRGCSARWPTAAGGWEHAGDPDAADRQGRGGHRHRRRTVRATRRRGARSSRTSSASRSRTSRCCTATPRPRRAAWTPTGRDRWRSAGSRWSRPAEKVIAKARPIAAHMMECAEDDLEFTEGTVPRDGAPRRPMAIADIALAVFAAHDLPDGVEPNLDSEATYRPGELLLPARHAPVRRRRSTPRPGR